MFCGTPEGEGCASQGCAIALALKDVFDQVSVNQSGITIYGSFAGHVFGWVAVPTPKDAAFFINKFDALSHAPHERLLMNEFSFTITLPPEVINAISIDDIYKSETLEIV